MSPFIALRAQDMSATPSAASAPAAPASAVAAGRGLAALVFRPDQTLKFEALELGGVSPAQVVTLAAGPAASDAETYAVRATGEFKVTPTQCELAGQGACALSVSFAPTKVGVAKGAIVVSGVQGGPTRVIAALAGSGVGLCAARGFVCEGWTAAWPTVALSLVFFVAMMFVRWNMVAYPAREQLRAEIDAVRTRVPAPAQGVDSVAPSDEPIAKLLAAAEERLHLGARWERLLNVFFWSRGHENMGFQLLHEAKERLVAASSPEVLRVELEVAEQQLRVADTAAARALADALQTELKRPVLDLQDVAAAALRETLAYLRPSATDVVDAIAAALASTPAASIDTMIQLASRLEVALAKDRQSALSLTLNDALNQGTSGMPPEFKVLLGHASGLPRLAETTRARLEAVRTNPAAVDVDWRRCLLSYQQEYLAEAQDLRHRIERALGAAAVNPPERWRALASEANNLLYARQDSEFAWTASWHKKTLWLIMLGLTLICVLAATLEHAVFLLLGALGGLMSRMQRMLGRDKVAVDYGQSWVTLFLSPVVGALAGWSGLLLVALAVKWGVLGVLFQDLSWEQPYHVLSLSLAMLFGISERLLVTVVETMEAKTGSSTQEKTHADNPEATAAHQGASATAPGKTNKTNQDTKAPP